LAGRHHLSLSGAADGQQGQFALNQWRVTLAEPIGQAGDLLDLPADPGSGQKCVAYHSYDCLRVQSLMAGVGVMNFREIWPTAFLAVGLIATIAWVGLLGYELFKLGGLAF